MSRAQPIDTRAAIGVYAELDPDAMTLEAWRATREALSMSLRLHEAIKPCCSTCVRFTAPRCSMHGEVPDEFRAAAEQCDDWLHDPVRGVDFKPRPEPANRPATAFDDMENDL